MAKTKVVLNLKGFRALRTSDNAKALVNEAAANIAKACGPGYVSEEAPGKNRARATVYADTPEAIADNAANLTLLKNFDAGR